MAVRGRGLVPCAALMLALTAACSTAEGTPVSVDTPTAVVSTTPRALEPATDCSKSDVQLEPETAVDGVELSVSTDPSHSSLLVKNVGSMAVLVVPDADFASRMIAAPYASPTDKASRAALVAVNSSGLIRAIREVPRYVPKNQIVVLPPQWAVCALTDTADTAAEVRYLGHKASSAQYLLTKALADRLVSKVDADKARPGLIRCARDTLILVTKQPDFQDIELYAEVLGPKSSCWGRVKGLLGNDERATQQLANSVLNELERAARLQDNTGLYDVLAG